MQKGVFQNIKYVAQHNKYTSKNKNIKYQFKYQISIPNRIITIQNTKNIIFITKYITPKVKCPPKYQNHCPQYQINHPEYKMLHPNPRCDIQNTMNTIPNIRLPS